MRPFRLIALLLSATLHLALVAPGVPAWREVEEAEPDEKVPLDFSEPDDGEEDGAAPFQPLPEGVFHVSLYTEPAPAITAASVAPAPAAVPVNVPRPVVALPLPAELVVAAPAPEPVPPEPLPEPVLSDADRAALAEMTKGEHEKAPADHEDDEDEAFELDKRQIARAMRRERARSKRAGDRRAPCPESSQSIARVAEAAWYIDRDLIEYYATHMGELQKLGYAYAHKDKVTKEPDGFRVSLARCSVLREGGLRSGDIVHEINGRRINNVLQAIGAYIALRKEPDLFVSITRKGEPLVLGYTIEQPVRGAEARAARKAARQAARKAETQAAR